MSRIRSSSSTAVCICFAYVACIASVAPSVTYDWHVMTEDSHVTCMQVRLYSTEKYVYESLYRGVIL